MSLVTGRSPAAALVLTGGVPDSCARRSSVLSDMSGGRLTGLVEQLLVPVAELVAALGLPVGDGLLHVTDLLAAAHDVLLEVLELRVQLGVAGRLLDLHPVEEGLLEVRALALLPLDDALGDVREVRVGAERGRGRHVL